MQISCRLIGFKVPLHEEEGEAVKCKAQKPFDFDDFESLAILGFWSFWLKSIQHLGFFKEGHILVNYGGKHLEVRWCDGKALCFFQPQKHGKAWCCFGERWNGHQRQTFRPCDSERCEIETWKLGAEVRLLICFSCFVGLIISRNFHVPALLKFIWYLIFQWYVILLGNGKFLEEWIDLRCQGS